MARRRMIDPNIWESEDVAALTIRQRLLLIGLFSNADDFGKGRANLNYIRSKVFPYDDMQLSEIESDIEAIKNRISILLYNVDGNHYYKFLSWEKWQTVQKPTPSKIPEPLQNDSRTTPELLQNDSGMSMELFQNDSNQVDEDGQNDSRLKEKKRKEVKRKEINYCEEEEKEQDDSFQELIRSIREMFGDLTVLDEYSIKTYINDGMNEELILLAFDRTLKYATNPSIKYAKGILNKWFHSGIKTVEQAEEKDPTQKGGVKNGRTETSGEPFDKSEWFSL
jgi:DnaD/phage-associated family protein